jgi:hypothetical protein
LFIVAGDDGSVKFSDPARTYLRKRGVKFLICPGCYEDKYLDDSPDYAVGSGGESICLNCGTIFNDLTGEIVCVDLATHGKTHKTLESITRRPANFATMTAADRQAIIDAETDELLNNHMM